MSASATQVGHNNSEFFSVRSLLTEACRVWHPLLVLAAYQWPSGPLLLILNENENVFVTYDFSGL